MKLKTKRWATYLKWGAISLVGLLIFGFFLRVLVFEAEYYGQLEGSERSVAVAPAEEVQEELIEVKPTEEEVVEYTVAPDLPRYLTIEKLGVYNARILAVGITADQEMATPNNIFDVGWYDGSGKPGTGDTMIIDGHNGGPNIYGVFKELPSLVEGDIIQIERGDGAFYKYRVVENKQIPLDEADGYMAVADRSPEEGKESVTLISCSGEWSQVQQTYLSRQFVRAVLVE